MMMKPTVNKGLSCPQSSEKGLFRKMAPVSLRSVIRISPTEMASPMTWVVSIIGNVQVDSRIDVPMSESWIILQIAARSIQQENLPISRSPFGVSTAPTRGYTHNHGEPSKRTLIVSRGAILCQRTESSKDLD